MRAVVHEAVQGVMVELPFSTPADAASLIAMDVRKVVLGFGNTAWPALRPGADLADNWPMIGALSTRQGSVAFPEWSTPGTIARNFCQIAEASQVADGGNAMNTDSPFEKMFDFGPEGLIVADSTLSLYILGDAGLGGLLSLHLAVYYQLTKITQNEFLAALSIMETI